MSEELNVEVDDRSFQNNAPNFWARDLITWIKNFIIENEIPNCYHLDFGTSLLKMKFLTFGDKIWLPESGTSLLTIQFLTFIF